jgi:hypothetical protein
MVGMLLKESGYEVKSTLPDGGAMDGVVIESLRNLQKKTSAAL